MGAYPFRLMMYFTLISKCISLVLVKLTPIPSLCLNESFVVSLGHHCDPWRVRIIAKVFCCFVDYSADIVFSKSFASCH